MTQSRERSVSVPPQLGTRAVRDADGPAARTAPVTDGPASTKLADRPDPDLPDEVRKELNRLIVELGERGIGGTWNPETEFQSHTIGELDSKAARELTSDSGTFRKKLNDWSRNESASGQIDMLMCVWSQCWPLWQSSLIYRTLEVVADAVADFAGSDDPQREWEGRALYAVGQSMGLLTADAAVYRQMNLSNPQGLAEDARKSRDTAGRVLEHVSSVLAARTVPLGKPEDGSTVIKHLSDIESTARVVQILYGSIAHAADALGCFERWLAVVPRLGSADPPVAPEGPSSRDTLRELQDSVDAAIGHLRESQKSLASAGDLGLQILTESEPWEQLLAEIQEIASKRDGQDSVQVFVPKRASVRYCYSFAVEAEPESLFAKKAEEHASSASSTGKPPIDRRCFGAQLEKALEFGKISSGTSPVKVERVMPLEPTDFFAAQDASSRLYDGIRLELSDILLSHNPPTAMGGESQPQRCRVWIDISYMGNHCLCIEPATPLEAPLPQVLFRTLRAGTPFVVGSEVIVRPEDAAGAKTAGAEARWDSLHSFSRDVIWATACAEFWKKEKRARFWKKEKRAREKARDDRLCAQPCARGNLHEIVVLRTDRLLGRNLKSVSGKLDRAVGGRIITRSVQRAATTLEEWVRYPPSQRTGGQDHAPTIAAVSELGLGGDWFTHTGETTIFGIVTAPEWHSDVYKEATQFAISWLPRLRLWSKTLDELIQTPDSAGQRAERAEELRFVEQRVRRHLSQIQSEELCATLAHRRFLDQLLATAGLDRLQGELEDQLAAAEHLTDWWDETERRKADHRRDALLFLIALFGLFELGGFMDLANATNLHEKFLFVNVRKGVWEDWLVLGLFMLALLGGIYYLLLDRFVRDLIDVWRRRRRARSGQQARSNRVFLRLTIWGESRHG